MKPLRIVLIKPSKYGLDGSVERFKKGFMPNATLYHIASLTPASLGDTAIHVHTVDEYVWQDLSYLRLLHHDPEAITLVALVGVQSHQLHRALDLAAYARHHGVLHCVIGGPHVMTCDTTALQGRGVSFALAEAELIWQQILEDAVDGELRPVYGSERRWADELPSVVINPPGPAELARYVVPLLGIYPVRGCPYRCNFCSVIKISGRRLRSPALESTLESLRLARSKGVQRIMFVSDNFNKFPQVMELLQAMIDSGIGVPFFCQCDAQIAREPELVELMGRAGCYEMFVGVESFNRKTLRAAGKKHNDPARYADIIAACTDAGIRSHFSNIIGFPDDDEAEIRNHLEILKTLHPNVASFYILTPIPGTEQYDDFSAAGLITESNLDRFDTTCPTWAHPVLPNHRLTELLYECYRRYYAFPLRDHSRSDEDRRFAIFSRYVVAQKMHPMSGGIGPVRVDSHADYLRLRTQCYGIEMAALPESLRLPREDEALNRRARWRIKPLEEAGGAGLRRP